MRGASMRNNLLPAIWIGAFALPLAACNDPQDAVSAAQTFGPSPTLPAPEHSWIPTIDIAPATAWPGGGKPVPPNAMPLTPFATHLAHPHPPYLFPHVQ